MCKKDVLLLYKKSYLFKHGRRHGYGSTFRNGHISTLYGAAVRNGRSETEGPPRLMKKIRNSNYVD